jgi:hypothetical protein
MKNDILPIAQKLLANIGENAPTHFEVLSGGANNRVYKILNGQKAFLLKHYLKNPLDLRNRQTTEFAFAQFGWQQEVRCIPQPLATDAAIPASLFTFIDGEPLTQSRLTNTDIESAIAFFQQLNTGAGRRAASDLPPASEACFSLKTHLSLVEQRLNLLGSISYDADNGEAIEYIEEALVPFGEKVLQQTMERAADAKLTLDEEIPHEGRVLSPSDFGFHNALASNDGTLTFFDFEYAGWDDPAKTVCDFFCQPKVPVSKKYLARFSEAVTQTALSAEQALERINILLPVYHLKWCCILLNDFLPADASRRLFAHQDAGNLNKRRAEQLQKSRTAFLALKNEMVH